MIGVGDNDVVSLVRLTSLVGGLSIEVRGSLGERHDHFFFEEMGENVTFFFIVDGGVVDYCE